MAHPKRSEASAVRDARLAYERALIDEGRADLAAGRSLSGDALDVWLDAFVGEGELPAPEALRKSLRK